MIWSLWRSIIFTSKSSAANPAPARWRPPPTARPRGCTTTGLSAATISPSKRGGSIPSLLPEDAPEAWSDRERLWNEVEAIEKRKDAQLAREIEIALPARADPGAGDRLAQDFVREQFVARGMVADLNVHWGRTASGEDQPHAHVMLTMRGWTRTGSARKCGTGTAPRCWGVGGSVGRSWQRAPGRARHRHAGRSSHAAQGIALEPQNKIGPAARRDEGEGGDAERAADMNRESRGATASGSSLTRRWCWRR